MSNFSVGQMVVCVDDDWPSEPGPRECDPVKGHIYTIRYIDPRPTCCYLQFEEIVPAEDTIGYRHTCFRPVKTTSIQIFRDLVVPIKDKVRA